MTAESDFVLDVFDLADRLPEIADRTVLRDLTMAVLAKIGVRYFMAARLPDPGSRLEPKSLARVWRQDWLGHYDRSEYFRRDPVVARCMSSPDPFLWSSIVTESDSIGQRVMDEAAEHGMEEGICVPVHGMTGLAGGVSMSGERLEMSSRMFRAVHLLGLSFFGSASRLVDREQPTTRPRLSPREREILSWYGAGLDAPAVAEKLGISALTVRDHTKSARRKLGVRTVTHAVVEAMRLREISP